MAQEEYLKKRYEEHLKRSRGGFLTQKARKRLLRTMRYEQGVPRQTLTGEGEQKMVRWEGQTPESDYWLKLRNSAKDALIDLKMVCDFAHESQLSNIFYEIDDRFRASPFLDFMMSLFLPPHQGFSKDAEWRLKVFEEIICRGLDWYINSGVLKTDANKEVVLKALDTIGKMGSGIDWKKRLEEEHKRDREIARERIESGGLG